MVPGWLTDIARDSGFAVRMLRKSPGFAFTAIATLALGIGATTAISSLVETILLRPLPFAESDRLVRLVENVPHVVAGRPPLQRGLSHGEFLDWRSRSVTLSDAAAVTWLAGAVRTDDGMTRLSGAMVTTNMFAMLGVRAAAGRTIEPADAANRDVIVVTDPAWRLQFRGDPAIVGKTVALRMSEQTTPTPVTVIGVLPPGFEFPVGSAVDFFRPMLPDAVYRQYSSDVIGRLAPDVTRAAAMTEANVIGQSVPARGTGTLPPNLPRFEVQGLKDRLVESLQPSLRIFLAAVAILLLIVCANVANLLLARGTSRQREIAVAACRRRQPRPHRPSGVDRMRRARDRGRRSRCAPRGRQRRAGQGPGLGRCPGHVPVCVRRLTPAASQRDRRRWSRAGDRHRDCGADLCHRQRAAGAAGLADQSCAGDGTAWRRGVARGVAPALRSRGRADRACDSPAGRRRTADAKLLQPQCNRSRLSGDQRTRLPAGAAV